MLAHSANDFSGNILIVEEDSNSREVLSDLLMAQRYEVRTAHNGVTALVGRETSDAPSHVSRPSSPYR